MQIVVKYQPEDLVKGNLISQVPYDTIYLERYLEYFIPIALSVNTLVK